MKLTAAQRRALEAVRDSRVARRYTRDGNAFRPPPGVGAASLRRLETLRLIRDARGARGGGLVFTVGVELTDAGRRVLWENPPETVT